MRDLESHGRLQTRSYSPAHRMYNHANKSCFESSPCTLMTNQAFDDLERIISTPANNIDSTADDLTGSTIVSPVNNSRNSWKKELAHKQALSSVSTNALTNGTSSYDVSGLTEHDLGFRDHVIDCSNAKVTDPVTYGALHETYRHDARLRECYEKFAKQARFHDNRIHQMQRDHRTLDLSDYFHPLLHKRLHSHVDYPGTIERPKHKDIVAQLKFCTANHLEPAKITGFLKASSNFLSANAIGDPLVHSAATSGKSLSPSYSSLIEDKKEEKKRDTISPNYEQVRDFHNVRLAFDHAVDCIHEHVAVGNQDKSPPTPYIPRRSEFVGHGCMIANRPEMFDLHTGSHDHSDAHRAFMLSR